jgi:hypothetical protein
MEIDILTNMRCETCMHYRQLLDSLKITGSVCEKTGAKDIPPDYGCSHWEEYELTCGKPCAPKD